MNFIRKLLLVFICCLIQAHAFATESNQPPTKFELLKKSAEAGDANAQYVLGMMFLQGQDNIPADPKKAIPWLTKAANGGIADAKYKPNPDIQDLERLFAYLLNFGWNNPKETVNGLFLYLGRTEVQKVILKGPYERREPNARIYSMCLRPNAKTFESSKKTLGKIIEEFLNSV